MCKLQKLFVSPGHTYQIRSRDLVLILQLAELEYHLCNFLDSVLLLVVLISDCKQSVPFCKELLIDCFAPFVKTCTQFSGCLRRLVDRLNLRLMLLICLVNFVAFVCNQFKLVNEVCIAELDRKLSCCLYHDILIAMNIPGKIAVQSELCFDRCCSCLLSSNLLILCLECC